MRPSERRPRLLTPVRAAALAALSALLALAGTASAATFRPPAGKILSGASTESPPSQTVPQFLQLTNQPGIATVNVFTGAKGSISDALKTVLWTDAAPMISWRMLDGSPNNPGGTLESVANGGMDAYLAQSAKDINANPRPAVFMRPMWEMNGDWYNWSYSYWVQRNENPNRDAENEPADYIAAWKRMHIVVSGGTQDQINAKLLAAGLPANYSAGTVPNTTGKVSWVWSVAKGLIRSPAAGETTESYYPGDDYVDWIGTSFHQTSCQPFSTWANGVAGSNLADPAVDPLSTLNNLYAFASGQRPFLAPVPGAPVKPLMLTEWAVSTAPFGCDDNTKKAAWMNDTAAWLDTHENAEGHLYFNRIKGEGSEAGENDHLLTTHTTALTAYRNYVDNPNQHFDWTTLSGVPGDPGGAPGLTKVESTTAGTELLAGAQIDGKESKRFRFIFDEAIAPTSFDEASEARIVGPSGNVTTNLTFEPDLKTFRLDPVDGQGAVTELPEGSYTIFLTGVKDVYGKSLPAFSRTFGVKDTTPPAVVQRTPDVNAAAIDVGSNVTVRFSEAVTGLSYPSSVKLRVPPASAVDATISLSGDGRTLTIDPAAPLAYSTTYTVELSGSIKDGVGLSVPTDQRTWTFTTAAAPPVTGGGTGGGATGGGTTGGGTTGGTTGGGTTTPTGRTATTDPCTGLSGLSLATCQARKTYTAAAARCAKTKGAAKAACIARAKAQQTFAVASAKCAAKKGTARTRCVAVAKAKRTVALKSAGCLLKTGKAKSRCQVSVSLLRKKAVR